MPTMHEVVTPEGFFPAPGSNDTVLASLSAEDRLAILEAPCRFEWAFDARRLDVLADLFTDDVVVDHVFGYRTGKKAVMEMMRSKVPSTGLRHQATNPMIFAGPGGTVCVLSYLLVTQVEAEGEAAALVPRILVHAVVTDEVRKEEGRWKVARRTFEQMKLPASYPLGEAARSYMEATAGEREVTGRL